MLRAIRLINEAKTAQASSNPESLTVDLHPSRPDYRGIMTAQPISMEADPTFDEIEAAGATVAKNAEPHAILDDMFLASGMIPRVTPYETGVIRGIRFDSSTKTWEKDELIADERLLMCNLKGMLRSTVHYLRYKSLPHKADPSILKAKGSWSSQAAATLALLTLRNMP
jgi:7,8-dihydropterin-6-yl-methyl-4-(beta-D-ribofuranosyl)aminobenzene 5'-phosphate synthase